MKNIEDSKVKRDNSVCTYLINNAAAFENNIAFETLVAKVKADYALTVLAAAATTEDNTGYSAEKLLAKLNAGKFGSECCASSQVKLDLLGNIILSQSLNSSPSYYIKASDVLCASRLQNVHDVMSTNLAIITPDYLTAAQLATLQTKIDHYTGISGTTTAVNSVTPVKTKALADAIKTGSVNIVNLKKLARKYIVINPTFYSGLLKVCKIPAVTIRHTPVIISVTDAATGLPLPSVSGTLSKTTELGIGTPSGIINYTNVSAGLAISTYSLPGYITGVQNVRIRRGKTNAFTFALVAGTMTTEMEEAINLRINAFTVAEAAKKAAKAAKAKLRREAKALKKGVISD